MTASLNMWEDQNNHQFSNVGEIENNIITDPNLIPNGLNHVQHQVPENKEIETDTENENQYENEIEENIPKQNMVNENQVRENNQNTLEQEINKKLQEAIQNNNNENEINEVIELSNKKKKNTYAAQLLSKYTNNDSESKVEKVNSLKCKTSNLNCLLVDLSRIFPLSIIILLLIFIVLLIVCMQA